MYNPSLSGGSVLRDDFGRQFPYLRLSITDVCNFKCEYCLPNGYQGRRSKFLEADEIARLVDAFADLGVYKIRLTGGEPTVRKDFADIARQIAAHPKIKQLAFTTNGYRLKDNAQTWRDAGLTHINVSVDTLDREAFAKVTGHDRLPEILEGIDAAQTAGFKQVKVNAVMIKGVNDEALPDFLSWAKDSPVSLRFIELMQTGDNLDYYKARHYSADGYRAQLLQTGWHLMPRALEAGPAEVYAHEDYAGTIGLIAPYSKDFCKGCNRLRVTATGDLRLCLFGSLGVPLRNFLQSDDQKLDLLALIRKQLTYKVSSHFLADGITGLTPNLASVGG
ncbi:MAG: GTP 3',8-cyclase MoaA [Alphaproteobacteria bacterium]